MMLMILDDVLILTIPWSVILDHYRGFVLYHYALCDTAIFVFRQIQFIIDEMGLQ